MPTPSPTGATPSRVLDGGRFKAYRPLTEVRRKAAFRAGRVAYERGDYFVAHELLEPAWMGTADPAERALYSGLIKLAAGYVHAVRGNPIGTRTNLRGARDRLARVVSAGGPDGGIDLVRLISAIEERLEQLEVVIDRPASERPTITLLGAPRLVRRRP